MTPTFTNGEFLVTCSNKDGARADQRITALGGPNFRAAPIDAVIGWIDEGKVFFVGIGAKRYMRLMVAAHDNGRRYVTVEAETPHWPPHRLIRLPDCPPSPTLSRRAHAHGFELSEPSKQEDDKQGKSE